MSSTTSKKFDHAVVVGASVAGLLAARVLAESFERITVIDRDRLIDSLGHRTGTPQARHTHAILKVGIDVFADLFPGIWNEMEADGSVRTDIAGDWVWFHHGVWKNRCPAGVSMYCQTRPLLEWHLKRRLKQYDNVRLIGECTVNYLLHDNTTRRVTGVHVKHKDDREEALVADLVVDASGRGTRSPRWLDELGYGRPSEKEIKIRLGYSSRLVKPSDALQRDWTNMIVLPMAPYQTKGGYIFPVEKNQWIVTLAGYFGDYPPADDEGFLEFAKQLPRPEFYEALKDTEPLTPIAIHRVPSSLRRYYEKMPLFPEGYAVLGDATCSMNPVFGQGMSVAALGVAALRQKLAEHQPGELFISRGFREAAGKVNDAVWRFGAIEDLRYPQAEGERFPGIEVIHWYIGALLELAPLDPELNRVLLEVLSLSKPLTAVLAPPMLLRVLKWSLGPRPQHLSNKMPRAVKLSVTSAPAFGARINSQG